MHPSVGDELPNGTSASSDKTASGIKRRMASPLTDGELIDIEIDARITHFDRVRLLFGGDPDGEAIVSGRGLGIVILGDAIAVGVEDVEPKTGEVLAGGAGAGGLMLPER